jgi:squalene-hopene/tetraprenyl-beta-curcumene cyclase
MICKTLSCFILCTMSLSAKTNPQTWSPKAAAGYLDARMDWWATWPKSARDHGTFCVSCHTAVPYALSRPMLRTALAETAPAGPEQKLLDNVSKRVRIWNEAKPFYSDSDKGPLTGKSYESRGTESVLNALILVTASGPAKLSDPARAALTAMWEQQVKTGERSGGFPWLDFHNRPFEAADSAYYGAALAAIAVGSAPLEYRADPALTEKIENLRAYVRREFAKQSPINRVTGLWADAKLHGILTAEQRASLLDEVFSAQQSDGGWSLTSLAGTWKRHDGTALAIKSDGYATGLVAWVLEQTGEPRNSEKLKRGLAWLRQNQNAANGLWPAWSLNKERDPSSDVGRFMTDAATAYAVMALTGAE